LCVSERKVFKEKADMFIIFVLAVGLSPEVAVTFLYVVWIVCRAIHEEILSVGGDVFNHSIENQLCHYD
jgi:hypothetical protein